MVICFWFDNSLNECMGLFRSLKIDWTGEWSDKKYGDISYSFNDLKVINATEKCDADKGWMNLLDQHWDGT